MSWPRVEDEVAAPQAEDDPSGDAGRPHDRAVDDPPQMLAQRVSALLGGLDHDPVLLGPQGQAVGAGDPALQQQLDRQRDRPRIAVGFPERDRARAGEASLMPLIAPGQPWNTATFSAVAS